MDIFKFTVISVSCLCGLSVCAIPSSTLQTLYDTLLKDYNTRIRPLKDQNQTVQFHTDFNPSNLICLDTTSQKMSLSAHFTFEWIDEFLRWNSTAFFGRESLQFSLTDIWHPIIGLMVSHGNTMSVGTKDEKVRVSHTGDVLWSSEGIFSLVCEVDITYYPFDTQECPITIYLSDESSADVLLLPPKTGAYVEQIMIKHPEWENLDMKTDTYTIHGTQLIKYRFLFRRRASFIMYTTVGPLIVLAFLNAVVFLLPINSGEKGSMSITVLLSFSVYISSISSILPPNSIQTPLLLVYMTILEINSALTVLYTVMESRIYNAKSPKPLVNMALKGCLCCKRDVANKVENISHDSGNVVERSTGDKEHAFHGIDIFMFFIYILINVVILVVLVSKINESFRERL